METTFGSMVRLPKTDIDKVKERCDKVQLGYMCIYVCIMNGMAENRRLVRT